MIDIVPKTLISLYGLITRGNYEEIMLKSMVILMLEELCYFKAFEFLESIIKDFSVATMIKLNARRSLVNLRQLYNALISEPKSENIEENPTSKQRARAATPSPIVRAGSVKVEKISHTRRQASSERPISSDIRPSTRIMLIPVKGINKMWM